MLTRFLGGLIKLTSLRIHYHDSVHSLGITLSISSSLVSSTCSELFEYDCSLAIQ